MIAVKKIVLSLCLILLGASVLSGCTKDEFLDQYNNIVQSAGSTALTRNSSLQGTKEKGIDDTEKGKKRLKRSVRSYGDILLRTVWRFWISFSQIFKNSQGKMPVHNTFYPEWRMAAGI